MIGVVATHVEAGGVLLTTEDDPHAGDGEQPYD